MAVKWYARQLNQMLDGSEESILRKAAFQCLAHAKVNIAGNDQVDTGFMVNSGYVAIEGEDTYAQTRADGQYVSAKTGDKVHARKAPKRSASRRKAIVAFAANYAIFQEMRKTYLYKALEQTTKELPQIISVGRFK